MRRKYRLALVTTEGNNIIIKYVQSFLIQKRKSVTSLNNFFFFFFIHYTLTRT